MPIVNTIERGINRAIAAVYQRKAPAQRRIPAPRARSFAGADTGRLFSAWMSSPKTADQVIYDDLSTLRARSRDSFHNNDFVRRYAGMVKTNVVGDSGVSLQARSRSLNRDELDKPANQAIESGWAVWGVAENCDIRQRLCWSELQRQAIVSAAIDGEILAHLSCGKGAGPFAFMVNHLDPELLDHSYNDDIGGRKIRMGIEYDDLGRRVAYHLLQASVGPGGYQAQNGKRYQSVPASEIIHAFLPDQISQSRGYPWISGCLGRLKMLDAYFDAALVAARAGASKMGFIKTQDGVEYRGDAVDDDGSTISDFEAGIIEQLSYGQEFQAFDPRYPHEQFPEFVKSCLRSIASDLNVSYAGLSGDLQGTSFASGRSALIEERDYWKILQSWFIESYCRPIFNRWLIQARLSGAIKIFGKPLSGPDEKYQRVSWQPRRWAWVDPAKDAKAKIDMAAANMDTISAAIREQGRDPDEVFEERARELATMKKLGLTDSDMVKVPAGTVTEDEDGSDEGKD